MPRKIALRRSPIHGNGVFAAVVIAPGTTLAEYRGRRLTHDQATTGAMMAVSAIAGASMASFSHREVVSAACAGVDTARNAQAPKAAKPEAVKMVFFIALLRI
jgi:hypothetical protein